MLAAGYPAWRASEETLALYESVLMPCDAGTVERVVLEIIRSPREFPPPVGLIYSIAEEIEEDYRRLEAERNRRWQPGLIGYTPSGQRMQAGEDGLMRPVVEPALEGAAPTKQLMDWVKRLIAKVSDPRFVRRRASIEKLSAMVPSSRANAESAR
jgi:hypothetical protein